ncbi:MAG TPA: abortive infection family protein [Longimicrobium sp.]|jgi:hypothetical protein
MPDLISRQTRTGFREIMVSHSAVREIREEFDAAHIRWDAEHSTTGIDGARRSLVEQFYATVDWTRWSETRRVLPVYEHFLDRLEERISRGDLPEENARSRDKLLRALARDGFDYVDGRIVRRAGALHLDELTGTVHQMDAPELQRQIERMRLSVEDDPGLAIGTAKELLESVARTILAERGVEAAESWDVARLVGAARESLSLLPEDIDSDHKGAAAIKRLLGQLGATVQSLAELRNLYGTGHGKVGSRSSVHPRHARLAVGAAATLATFLLETHQSRGLT